MPGMRNLSGAGRAPGLDPAAARQRPPVRLLAAALAVFLLPVLLSGCRGGLPFQSTETPTPTGTAVPSRTPTPTFTAMPTNTPTVTRTPTPSLTPTITETPSITPTPTFDPPDVTVLQQAHCRYGPSTAYLHAGDLYPDDRGELWSRNHAGTWLLVRFDKLWYSCWVAASLVDVQGDIFSVITSQPRLPVSTLYGPVQQISAVRNGNDVVVSWDDVWMTEDDDRGYFLLVTLCQNGLLYDTTAHTMGTSYTFDDDPNCDGKSGGIIRAVEKHGYTDPVKIPWP